MWSCIAAPLRRCIVHVQAEVAIYARDDGSLEPMQGLPAALQDSAVAPAMDGEPYSHLNAEMPGTSKRELSTTRLSNQGGLAVDSPPAVSVLLGVLLNCAAALWWS